MSRPILTTPEMRAAEQAVIGGGTTVEQLMERAGDALAEAAYRYAGPVSTLRTGPAAKTSAHELAVSSAGAAPAPVSTIRGKIARRMRESLASTAQYTLHASAEAGDLLTLRARICGRVQWDSIT